VVRTKTGEHSVCKASTYIVHHRHRTNSYISASSGIRTHDPSVRTDEDISFHTRSPHGHWDPSWPLVMWENNYIQSFCPHSVVTGVLKKQDAHAAWRQSMELKLGVRSVLWCRPSRRLFNLLHKNVVDYLRGFLPWYLVVVTSNRAVLLRGARKLAGFAWNRTSLNGILRRL
jgi:hypothetical protein